MSLGLCGESVLPWKAGGTPAPADEPAGEQGGRQLGLKQPGGKAQVGQVQPFGLARPTAGGPESGPDDSSLMAVDIPPCLR